MALVEDYIAAYNAAVADDPDLRIGATGSIWRGFTNQAGAPNRQRPRFSSRNGIDCMIRRRSRDSIGQEISCHDMRRTLASLLQQKDWSMKKIQTVLGHSSSATTDRYVGELVDMAALLSTSALNFVIPAPPSAQEPLL